MNNTFSKKINEAEINLIHKYMLQHSIDSFSPYIRYLYKTKSYTMTIYKNNSILIQGKDFDNILKLLKVGSTSKIHIEENKKNITIGSDEVGTGDLFGGIIVVSCKLIDKKKIINLGIGDSKKFDNTKIIELFHKIKDYVIFGKYEISPEEYNEIYDKYKNLNIIKTLGHYIAIKSIANENDQILIDQFCTEKKFLEYLNKLKIENHYKIFLETKAEDKYLEVACASIIARYFFIDQIKRLSIKSGINIPFGSQILPIKAALKKMNTKNKEEYLKMHFKNSSI